MLIQQRATLPVPIDAAWQFFRDIPTMATCVPGVEEVRPGADDSYQGVMTLRVGPLALKMAGTLSVLERDDAARRLVLNVSAEDRRLASAAEARVTVALASTEPASTDVQIDADTTVRGKLGQFGQGMIKHAADDVLKRFAACVRQRLESQEAGGSAVS